MWSFWHILVLGVTGYGFKARFAHLCTVMSKMHHRREGYPFGSLVDFAPDPMGRKSFPWLCLFVCLVYVFDGGFFFFVFLDPIFSFSPLAIHTRNILAEPRCTLVVQVQHYQSCLNYTNILVFTPFFVLCEFGIFRYQDGVAYRMQE